MNQLNSNEYCFLNNNNCKDSKYAQVPRHENTEKVWVNNFRGSIVESNYNPSNNRITQYSMQFNQPQHYKNYFDSNHIKRNIGSCKNVNRDLFLTHKMNN
mgnify:CR=1 FL=1